MDYGSSGLQDCGDPSNGDEPGQVVGRKACCFDGGPTEDQRYPPLVIWVGEEKGKVRREVQKINASLPRILSTVSAKGKSTEKTMLYCFQNTFRKIDARHLYTLDGAPLHMHASLCIALALLLYFMYISPPNTTPWCQGCDKAHIN